MSREGINAFLNRHGAIEWPADPWNLPERGPGVEVTRSVVVEPGGNDVRSYLDVLFPDDTSWDDVAAALTGLCRELVADEAVPAAGGSVPNPAVFQRGPVTIRFGTDLLSNRALELSELRSALEQLRA